MKKNLMFKLTWGMAVLCLLLFTGCKEKSKVSDSPFFKSIQISKLVHLTADSLSPACNIEINLLHAAHDDSIAASINKEIVKAAFSMDGLSPEAAVDTFVAQYAQKYSDELLPYYLEDKKADRRAMCWYDYYYSLDSKVGLSKEGVYNYIMELNSYEGGAHGSSWSIYLNFCMESGKLITLDDIFIPGYESMLNDILLKSLMKQIGVDSLDKLQEEGYLMWTSMYPAKNFLLQANEVVFLYNAYEIAPYALGTTELNIPYKDLSNLLLKK